MGALSSPFYFYYSSATGIEMSFSYFANNLITKI